MCVSSGGCYYNGYGGSGYNAGSTTIIDGGSGYNPGQNNGGSGYNPGIIDGGSGYNPGNNEGGNSGFNPGDADVVILDDNNQGFNPGSQDTPVILPQPLPSNGGNVGNCGSLGCGGGGLPPMYPKMYPVQQQVQPMYMPAPPVYQQAQAQAPVSSGCSMGGCRGRHSSYPSMPISGGSYPSKVQYTRPAWSNSPMMMGMTRPAPSYPASYGGGQMMPSAGGCSSGGCGGGAAPAPAQMADQMPVAENVDDNLIASSAENP